MSYHFSTRYRHRSQLCIASLCFVVCLLYFVCVLLSSYYLEQRYSLSCRPVHPVTTAKDENVVKSDENVVNSQKFTLQELQFQNDQLKIILSSLLDLSSTYRIHDEAHLIALKRQLEYFQAQDLKHHNLVQERMPRLSSNLDHLRNDMAELRSWSERGLKNVNAVAGKRDEVNPSLGGVNRVGFLPPTALGCAQISQIVIQDEVGRGYTKIIQRGRYGDGEVAVKSTAIDSIDIRNCLKKKRAKVAADCLIFSRYKVMKELLLYQQLSHPNVVKLLGYCFQNDQETDRVESRGLTVVTELGIPLNLITVLQMAWHERFRIAVGLARLVKYFSQSSLGSLVIRDFQLTQFVIIDGDVKISDLDDVGNEPHSCRTNDDCVIGNRTNNITLPCVNSVCEDYNERWNLYNMERFYFRMFLQPGAPQTVAQDLKKIGKQLVLFMYDAMTLLRDLEAILTRLRDGYGLEEYRARYQYTAVPRADFPGSHDYECEHSLSLVNCQSLVYNENEAMKQCDDDVECTSFVLSYKKTWIGYKWAYFKNNSTGLVFSPHNIVYVKIT